MLDVLLDVFRRVEAHSQGTKFEIPDRSTDVLRTSLNLVKRTYATDISFQIARFFDHFINSSAIGGIYRASIRTAFFDQ
jgi:hypothetical protein